MIDRRATESHSFLPPADRGGGRAPKVSIVMPTYNSAEYLVSTVGSVLAQTEANWELVLFDDGSTDATISLSRDLAGNDARIHLGAGAHLGVGAARNGGFALTDPRSDFVVFLDSDDTWEPNALEALTTALENNPGAVAVHAIARATDMEGRQFDGDDLSHTMRTRAELRGDELVELPVTAPTTFAAMLIKNCVVTPGTCLIRREVLESVGALDPATSPADDWDLNVRLARRGDFVLVDQVILNWRRHPDSLSNVSRRHRRAYLGVRRRSVVSRENTSEQRRNALNVLRRDCQAARHSALEKIRHRNLRAVASSFYYAVELHGLLFRVQLLNR